MHNTVPFMPALESNPRVLVISSDYPDAERPFHGAWIHKHVRQMAMAGCEVQVLTTKCPTLATYFKNPRNALNYWFSPTISETEWEGIHVHIARFHLGLPTQVSPLAAQLALRALRPVLSRIYDQFAFDLIFAWTGEYLALAASCAAQEVAVPFIATAVGSDVNLACAHPHSLRFRIERDLFLNSNCVLCVSADLEQKVRDMTGGLAHTQVFCPGVDLNLFCRDDNLRCQGRARLGFTEREKVLTFTGNLKRPKGIFDLLDAFARLSPAHPDLRLLLAGVPVERQRIQAFIRRHGLTGRVTLTGGMALDAIPGILNSTDIFVFPSWMEGLPNAVMEACACERPVIASHVGGIPELIEDGVTGRLVPPHDPATLARVIREVLDDPQAAAAQARAARSKMEKQFCWLKNSGKVLAFVQAVLGQECCIG